MILKDLSRIIFPDFCIHCGVPLVGDEKYLCTNCLLEISWARHAAIQDNETELRLAGHIPCQSGAALMIFQKGHVTQSIIHHIKYHGFISLGLRYGRLLGQELKDTGRFNEIDYIIPVPLHWLKKIRRGYNQSELICQGISQIFGVPILKNNLVRTKYTQTQTNKNRAERQENMQGVFKVRHPEQLKGKHILLIDDIITTGATFDACYQALKHIPDLRISVAALGLVKQN